LRRFCWNDLPVADFICKSFAAMVLFKFIYQAVFIRVMDKDPWVFDELYNLIGDRVVLMARLL